MISKQGQKRIIIIILSGILSLFMTNVSLAQTSDNEPEDAKDESIFQEIIVTAEKRNESLQDLSQAVTALFGDELDAKNIVSFVDLSSIAPGVTITKNEGFKTVIAIRGLGNEANQNAIANPSVSYHLDGVYIASPFAIQTDFIDLERIEILRGPQGTLFGQNSTGGAINVITTAPTMDDIFGSADISFGEYNSVRARASVNIPLGETTAIRASLSSYSHDGFSKNVVLGQELDDADNFSARVRFLWQPTDTFTLNLSGQYFDAEANGAAQKSIIDTTPGARNLAQDSLGEFALESSVYSMIAEWDLSSITLKTLTSYQKDDVLTRRDNDRTDLASLPPFTLLPSWYDPETNEQKTFTQEINIISNEQLFGSVDWIAGLFFLDTEVAVSIRERIDFGFDGVFDPYTVDQVLAFGGDVGFITDSLPTRKSFSVYAQGTHHQSDTLRVIGGIRHTSDEIKSTVTNFFGRSGTENIERSTDEITGRLAIEYDAGDTTLVYGSFTRGFKPGGANLTFGRESIVAPAIVLPIFEDEKINAFELGLKTDFADGRIRANVAAFFYQYENMQFQATDPEIFQGGVGNIPQSEISGLELELLASLATNWILDLKLSVLNTEITSSFLALDNVLSDAATNALLFSVCGGNLFCDEIQVARADAILDVKGNELGKSPRFSADLSLRYEREIGDEGLFSASFQYTYRGEFQQRIFNNPTTDDVPSYNTFNTVLSFYTQDQKWKFDFLALNITSEDGINARFTDVFGVGSTSDELIPPRQIMGRVTYYF
jgi:iron complex outermembrane receptor protein